MTHPMNLDYGSVLGMTPATGTVAFRDRCHGEYWSLPLTGYAVVLLNVDEDTPGTEVQPVVLEDRHRPVTLMEYLDNRSRNWHLDYAVLHPSEVKQWAEATS